MTMERFTDAKLLLHYLLARKSFGNQAGEITRKFATSVLGIENIDHVVSQLQRSGHQVIITEDGALSLR